MLILDAQGESTLFPKKGRSFCYHVDSNGKENPKRHRETQTSIESRLEPISFKTNLTSIITEDARIPLTLSDARLKTDTTIITDRQIK